MQEPTLIVDSLRAPLPPAHAAAPRRYPWLLPLIAGPLLVLLLRLFPALDYSIYHSALGHVIIVGGGTLLGSLLALLVLRSAARAADGRVFFVGMGFLATASIFAIHAIATPDVLMSGRGLASVWSALVSLVAGSCFFAFSGLELSGAANRFVMRHVRLWLALFLALFLAYAWAVLVWVPSLPTPPALGDHTSAYDEAYAYDEANESHEEHAAPAAGHEHAEEPHEPDRADAPLALVWPLLGAAGILGYIFAALRHYQFYRRAPSRAGLALCCGIALLGEALISQRFAPVYTLLFWLYHVQEFAGFGVISYALLVAYRRGQSDEYLLESLFLSGTRARLRASYTQAMDSLLATLARGEQPTPALRQTLREQFQLGESQLQVFEHAAAAVLQERQQRTELEQLNAALRQLERDRDQFTQMLVHDLRSPLTSLIGFLDLLNRSPLDADQQMLLGSAQRSGRNLAELIDDLLDIGRIEAGHIELDRSPVALRLLCDGCAAEVQAWLLQEEKTLTLAVPDDLPLIAVDARLLRRVLLNLLANAIKHTPPGTQITLRAFTATPTEPQNMVIEVADTGDGIPAEHLEHIFEKYGRVKDGHGQQGSTGLGLTFCRLAVEAHGGTIDVRSRVGAGTTFRVTLPAVRSQESEVRSQKPISF